MVAGEGRPLLNVGFIQIDCGGFADNGHHDAPQAEGPPSHGGLDVLACGTVHHRCFDA
jgi:hypothetical protein